MDYYVGPNITVLVEGLQPLTRYAVRVSAINEVGESEFTAASYLVTGPKPIIIPPPDRPYSMAK
jgi:hypothetical protein